jgi:EAL and modified HD-GYP domain-containing signal transduction protein
MNMGTQGTSMLNRLFNWLFRAQNAPGNTAPDGDDDDDSDGDGDGDDIEPIEVLNQQAPLRQVTNESEENPWPDKLGTTIICREAVLNRQQKVAGYQFLLQDATHAHIRFQNRRILHLYAEVLVDNLMQANIGPLLGYRIAFIEVPDSFLDQPQLTRLPVANTYIIIRPVEGPGAPTPEQVLAQVRALRATGYRIGIPDPITTPACFHLLGEVDLVCIRAPHLNVEQSMRLIRHILKEAPNVALLVRDLPGMEDFNFSFKIGATLFQGPFITSRERWQQRNLDPNFTRLTLLLNKLRQDADTREIVALLKQDAAITLRLLRYINSAANGLRENVSSLERALILLGRAPLQRWLTLLLCASDRNHPRAAAVLEVALVRARTMELIAHHHPPAVREAMFLTGLLSLIDVILQRPIEDALATLSIDNEIRDAILNGHGPYAITLSLAKACEKMDIDGIVTASAICQIDPEQASTWYMDALAWTLQLQQENVD